MFVGTLILYQCNQNYFYDGRTNHTIRCNNNGNWNVVEGSQDQYLYGEERMQMIGTGCVCECFQHTT